MKSCVPILVEVPSYYKGPVIDVIASTRYDVCVWNLYIQSGTKRGLTKNRGN